MNGSRTPIERRVPQAEVGVPEREEAVESNIEKVIDGRLEHLLLESGRKVNEGQNGVIFRLDLRDVPAESLEELERLGIDLHRDFATKILKVYSRGQGKTEFEMHKRAHEALARNPEAAQAPEPFLYRDLELSEVAQEELRRMNVRPNSRVEILMMDFIEGEDLATILFREALVRKFPELYESIDDLRGRSVDDLHREVSAALDFRYPGGRGGTEAEREFEKRKVAMENSAKLYRFLQSKGFVLDASIVDSLQESVELLHANGIVHRDAHERNFMVSGGYERGKAGDAKVYMIDFGTAKEFQGAYRPGREDLFVDDTGQRAYLQDEMVVNLLRPLTEGKEEMKARIRSETVQRVMGDVSKLRKDAAWVQKRNEWFDRIDKESIDAQARISSLFNHYIGNKSRWSDEGAWNRFGDFVATFAERGLIDPDEAGDALTRLTNETMPPVAKNRLRDLALSVRAIESAKTRSAGTSAGA